MIILDICMVVLVLLVAGIYREVYSSGKVARAHYKVQGLQRFK